MSQSEKNITFESLLFEPAGEDCPVGILGEDPAALIVAVGVVRQAHCAGEIPDDGGEGCGVRAFSEHIHFFINLPKFLSLIHF